MYNFDEVVNRFGTDSVKWDLVKTNFQTDDIIPMWVADMDFKVLPEIRQALEKRLSHEIYGYSCIGNDYLQAVVDWMKNRHHWEIASDWIVTTPGVVSALAVAVNAFTTKGDAVIIQKPVYYPFDRVIEANGRVIIENPTIFCDNHYEIDFEDFEKKIVENNVKMYILCNPYNPIGKVWTYEELKRIGDICKKHHVIVASDEIHHDFIYEGYKHIPFYEVDSSYKEFSIICTAPSKTFNLAGMQTSNIIIANEEMRQKFVDMKTASGVNDANFLGRLACQTAYTYGAKWVDELVAYLNGNLEFMISYFKENLPQVNVIKPQGLYLVWVDFRSLGMEHEALEKFMLEKAKVWLDEGYIFGHGGEGFERFNIAMPRCLLEKALKQVAEAVKSL